MKNRWLDFAEGYHNAFRVIGNVMTWGSFLLIVVTATVIQGFPNGFILGVILGGVLSLLMWWSFRKRYHEAVRAREKLYSSTTGQRAIVRPGSLRGWAIFTIMGLGIISFLVISTCAVNSCKNDPVRPGIFFILIGTSIAIEKLFYEERIKGKYAPAAFIFLFILAIFLIERVISAR